MSESVTTTSVITETAVQVQPSIREVPPHAVERDIKGLFRASSHYLAGLLGKIGIGFISLPILTRLFSIADYGVIDLAGKILLLLTALSKMGLQNSALRFFDSSKLRPCQSGSQCWFVPLMSARGAAATPRTNA